MLPESPFTAPGFWATLENTQGVVLPLSGNEPACAQYRLVGLQMLGSRRVPFAQFLDELKEAHEGHWFLGMQSLGWTGKSVDVGRAHHMTAGECTMGAT